MLMSTLNDNEHASGFHGPWFVDIAVIRWLGILHVRKKQDVKGNVHPRTGRAGPEGD
jgi:hypothetical protein